MRKKKKERRGEEMTLRAWGRGGRGRGVDFVLKINFSVGVSMYSEKVTSYW